MRVRVVFGVALALVGAAVVLALSQRGERMAGSSFVLQQNFMVVVPGGGKACQPGTLLADDSAAAQLLVGTYGKPLPALTVTFADADGTTIARGRAPRGPREGPVTVRFAHPVDGNRVTTACVRNVGPERAALAGDIAGPEAAARVDGRAAAGVFAFRYLREGRESWWSLAPVVAQRFGLGKAGLLGTWTLPLCGLMLAAAWVAVIRLLLRERDGR